MDRRGAWQRCNCGATLRLHRTIYSYTDLHSSAVVIPVAMMMLQQQCCTAMALLVRDISSLVCLATNLLVLFSITTQQ